jgi:exodeoxyribonuclease VII large subunit
MNKPTYFPISAITKRVTEILQPVMSKYFWVRAEIQSGNEKGGTYYCTLVETNNKGQPIAKIACHFGFKIYLADSKMQGADTEKAILASLQAIEKIDVDVVIIIRGGGSKTDLFDLDNEAIARYIAHYKYPIFTGIGHEIDISILDSVAYQFYKTPTAVAEDLVAKFTSMQQYLYESSYRLQTYWYHQLERNKSSLSDAQINLRKWTEMFVELSKNKLHSYANDLSLKVTNKISQEKNSLSVKSSRLTSLPITIIKRQSERVKVNKITLVKIAQTFFQRQHCRSITCRIYQ